MYAPDGFGLSEVGDIEVVPVGDELHLFHLTLPNHDVVQHAVSHDGLAWRPLPTALRTGDPGDCDDDQIWTMSVTERDGAYVMLYTALAHADRGLVQRIALARSPDLIHWTKGDRNPVAAADPRWYETDPAVAGSVSWRDPKPIRVGDTYYAVVCAREKDGPLLRRGCVGLFASTDLEEWEVRPPLFAPRSSWDLECPQVFAIGDTYYLTAAVVEGLTQRYWVAPRFEGPYEVPPDEGILAPAGHYAGRICRWGGLDLYFCWHLPSQTGGRSWARPEIDWTTTRNPYGKFVVAPLVLTPRADGSLARRSLPGWSAYRERELAPPPPAVSLLRDADGGRGQAWRVAAPGGGMDVVAPPDEVSDAWFEGTLTLDASRGGIGFRLDGEGGGYFVELRTGSTEVSLRKWLPTRAPGDGRPSFRFAELQRGHLQRPVVAGDRIPFRLLVVGPYLECSLSGEVVLATLSAERERGRLGLWAESGALQATDLLWAPMRRPCHGI